ncbi:MAG: PKD domain-containing protein [Ferruginibacter sp.]|nr:PKD domain-containing protein [Cytophagales bacterium]
MGNRKAAFHLFGTILFFLHSGLTYAQRDIVAYAGNTGAERFNTVLQLSDSTYLVGGSATNLNWLSNGPSGPAIPRTQIGRGNIRNERSTRQKIGLILHISKDLKTILRVVHFAKGDVEDIRHLKTNTVPGAATDDIYISGNVEYTERAATNGVTGRYDGYFLARLNNNFVGGAPNGLTWSFNVWATGLHKSRQPWDVGGDGKVVYVTGEPYGTDGCVIKRRKADGSANDIVPDWTTHAGTNILDGSPTLGEWTPAFSNAQVKPQESMVNLKLGRCSLRSWTAADYSAVYNDENGTVKRGRWPLDYFYDAACNVSVPGATQSTPGYTGYQSGANPTGYVGGIAVDKQTNDIYFGASFQSVTAAGQPDVEPFVMAYSSTGARKWWARLYQETGNQSPPDQYVDALTLDYSGAQRSVLVVGRQNGNAVKPMWAGNTIQNNPLLPFGTATFTQQFTGTNSNLHASWLGKYRAASGDLLYSTYVAGFAGSSAGLSAASVGTVAEALDFPSHNQGWPDLSDTRAEIDVKADATGRVYLLLRTRGFTTTNNAYQRQEPPLPNLLASNRRDTPGDGVVVYEPDLKQLVYSSLLTGEWNRSEPNPSRGSEGGGNTGLLGLFPWKGGVTVVGFHHDQDVNAIPDGVSIPFYFQHKYGTTTNTTTPAFTPDWGKNTLQNNDGETAILARLTFTKKVRADFKIDPAGGSCTNTDVKFTDLSYADTGIGSWSWGFGAGAVPATSAAQSPTVQWTTVGEKTVSLTVRGNDGTAHTRTITYFVDQAPGAAFTYTGSPGPAPASLTFQGPTGAGLTYLWEITDPTTGGITTYSTDNPSHVFAVGGTPGTAYPVRLTVAKGACAQSSSQTITITAGPGPLKPDFTIDGSVIPPVVCLGQAVTFKQTNAANATTWQWDFGDGATPLSATTAGPHQVTYRTPGPKIASLTVGNGINQATYETSFGVAASPTASFSIVLNTPNAPAVAYIKADEPNAKEYLWDFGLAIGDEVGPQVKDNVYYGQPGEYVVKLTVTSQSGCKNTYVQSLVIGSSDPANTNQPNFSFGPAGGACVNNKVSIWDMSVGGQSTSSSNFRWDFGNDAQPRTSSAYKPPLIYWTKPGKKVVVLTITDGGKKRVKSQVYEVFPYPVADFSVDAANSSCAGSPYKVVFSPVIESGNFYQWSFGTAGTPATSSSTNPEVTYSADGTYPVQLTVNRDGCQSVSVKNVQLGGGTCGIPALAAGISLQPGREGCASNQYVVQSISTGNIAATGYAWTFPANGSVSKTGPGPKTLLLNPGDVVTLKVTDQSGNTDTVNVEVP